MTTMMMMSMVMNRKWGLDGYSGKRERKIMTRREGRNRGLEVIQKKVKKKRKGR